MARSAPRSRQASSFGCAGRYRYPQAEGLGHLDGVGANAAGAAVNQDGLPR